jgi:hypothetical protein
MTDDSSSDGSSSVCTKQEYSPVHYHWYRKNDGLSILESVQRICANAGLGADDTSRMIGEVRARLWSLLRGQLVPKEHIKGPVATVTDISLYEVRASIEINEQSTFAMRFYHVEPVDMQRQPGATVILLHIHAKDLSDPATVNELQNKELQFARFRFHDGRTSSWGGAVLLPSP